LKLQLKVITLKLLLNGNERVEDMSVENGENDGSMNVWNDIEEAQVKGLGRG